MKYLQTFLVVGFILTVSAVFSQTSVGPILGFRFSAFNKAIFLVEQFGPKEKYKFYDNAPVFGLRINQKLYKIVDMSISGLYYKSSLKDYSNIGEYFKFQTIGIGMDLNANFAKPFQIGIGGEYNFILSSHWPYRFEIAPVIYRTYYNLNLLLAYNLNNFIFEAKFFRTFPKHSSIYLFDDIYGFQLSTCYKFQILK